MRTILSLLAGMVGGLLGAFLFAPTLVGAQSPPAENTTYTPITPCASFDSRSDYGPLEGKYAHSEARSFQITGAAPATQQDGVNCGVPYYADAVLINIVAIQPDTGGNLRSYATGSTGTGGVVNYAPVSPNLNNSNAVAIPLSAAGQLTIENNCGGCGGDVVHARGVILGYYSDSLAQQVEQLSSDLTYLYSLVWPLHDKLDGVSRTTVDGYDTFRFTGMNVQLVSGAGDTYTTQNGLGNLILGYHQNISDDRTGSHNLIVGGAHSYTKNGTVLFGYDNMTGNDGATVTGGLNNEATGHTSSVTGGVFNYAYGQHSSITGGASNGVGSSGIAATVSGGRWRFIDGTYDWQAGNLFRED